MPRTTQPDSAASAGRGPGGQDLLLAVLPAMVIPFVGALIYFVAYSGESWARVVYVLVKIYTLVWPLVAVRLFLDERLPRPDLTAPRHRRALPAGLLVGALLAGAGLALMATPLGAALNAHTGQIRLKVGQLGWLNYYVAFALFLSFIHSALEEYYWRWFVFGTLARLMRPRPAAVLASLAFASHHFVILTQYFPLAWAIPMAVAVAAGGYLWCSMYRRQRTLVGAWISHVIVDLAILGIGYRLLF